MLLPATRGRERHRQIGARGASDRDAGVRPQTDDERARLLGEAVWIDREPRQDGRAADADHVPVAQAVTRGQLDQLGAHRELTPVKVHEQHTGLCFRDRAGDGLVKVRVRPRSQILQPKRHRRGLGDDGHVGEDLGNGLVRQVEDEDEALAGHQPQGTLDEAPRSDDEPAVQVSRDPLHLSSA